MTKIVETKDIKLIIICPALSVTGGPELLHQLASSLNDQGIDASICYYPFGSQTYITPEYNHYNTNVINLPSELQSYMVLASEYHTKVLSNLNSNNKIVWWLSVDNYFRYKDDNAVKNLFKRLLGPFVFRTPLRNLRSCIHLAQSQYAIDFLMDRGLSSIYLGDYLNKDHKPKTTNCIKENWIAYNLQKSSHFVSKMSKRFPQLVFKPIAGLSPEGVNLLLHSCKIYLDFGRHPGKDRLPREAALAGCCVITGTRGSARNKIDIPIPNSYKFSDRVTDQNLENVKELIIETFANYKLKRADFDDYRAVISNEYEKFHSDVMKIFGDYRHAE